MKNRKMWLFVIPLIILFACLLYLFVPPGADRGNAAQANEENRTPTCAVEKQAVVGDPQTITVKAGEKIQTAVDKARPGDTILISSGTYNEGVVVKRNNITVRGEGQGDTRPVLDGQKQIGNGIIACGDQFVVENLIVKNYQANGKDRKSVV